MSNKIIADGEWENHKWVMDEFDKLRNEVKRMYRNVASAKLSLEMAGSGQGIGSSDISNEALSLFELTKGDIGELVDINWEITEGERRMVENYKRKNSKKNAFTKNKKSNRGDIMNDKIVAKMLIKIAEMVDQSHYVDPRLVQKDGKQVGTYSLNSIEDVKNDDFDVFHDDIKASKIRSASKDALVIRELNRLAKIIESYKIDEKYDGKRNETFLRSLSSTLAFTSKSASIENDNVMMKLE